MKLRNHYSSSSVDEENPYWVSFSDIMASLLIIFMLAVVALMLALSTKQEKFNQELLLLQKAESVRKDILLEITRDLKMKNIFVEIADNDTVLRIPERVLNFASGSSDIPPNFQSNIREVGNVLFKAINKIDSETKKQKYTFLDTIFVEGHTDAIPYQNAALKGNWGLSTFRAISVWQFWLNPKEPSYQLGQMKNHTNKALFSVSGYAETRPAECSEGDTACKQDRLSKTEALERNRRIDIRFTIKKPTEEDYQQVKEQSK